MKHSLKLHHQKENENIQSLESIPEKLATIIPEYRYLFSLLNSVLYETDPAPPPENLNWKNFWNLAKRQKVDSLIYYACRKLESVIPAEVMSRFQQSHSVAIRHEAYYQYELNLIFRKFNEQNIRYMPLKGYVLKSLYPSSDMRTMSDVDILLDRESLPIAEQIIKSCHFVARSQGINHHDVYTKPPCVMIELHHELFDPLHSPWKNPENLWERATRIKSTCEYQMDIQDFYLHLLTHLAYHYRFGYVQVRQFIDLWIFREKYGSKIDDQKINRTLSELKLEQFILKVNQLIDVWFHGQKSDEILDQLTAEILQEHSVENFMARNLTEFSVGGDFSFRGRFRFLINRIFPQYKEMARWYPLLQKYRVLLPFFWGIRIIKSLFNASSRNKFFAILRIKKSELIQTDDLNKKTGIQK